MWAFCFDATLIRNNIISSNMTLVEIMRISTIEGGNQTIKDVP